MPTHNEKLSLQQLLKVLGNHQICFFTHKQLDLSEYTKILPETQYCIEYFHHSFFENISGYNKLLTSKKFYSRFKSYDFLLLYQLDAWVFNDELNFWCESNYDYIGAPWYEKFHEASKESRFTGIGNGGFSLRKISSYLKVLNSLSYIIKPSDLLKNYSKIKSLRDLLKLPLIILDLTIRNNTFFLFKNYRHNEDFFWGHYAPINFKWFRVPSEDVAIKFSFETNPDLLFNKNKNKLPFGCHAWEKYNADFWQQHIHAKF